MKKLFTLLLVFFASLFLVGCKNNTNKTASEKTTTLDPQTVLEKQKELKEELTKKLVKSIVTSTDKVLSFQVQEMVELKLKVDYIPASSEDTSVSVPSNEVNIKAAVNVLNEIDTENLTFYFLLEIKPEYCSFALPEGISISNENITALLDTDPSKEGIEGTFAFSFYYENEVFYISVSEAVIRAITYFTALTDDKTNEEALALALDAKALNLKVSLEQIFPQVEIPTDATENEKENLNEENESNKKKLEAIRTALKSMKGMTLARAYSLYKFLFADYDFVNDDYSIDSDKFFSVSAKLLKDLGFEIPIKDIAPCIEQTVEKIFLIGKNSDKYTLSIPETNLLDFEFTINGEQKTIKDLTGEKVQLEVLSLSFEECFDFKENKLISHTFDFALHNSSLIDTELSVEGKKYAFKAKENLEVAVKSNLNISFEKTYSLPTDVEFIEVDSEILYFVRNAIEEIIELGSQIPNLE